MTHVVFTTNDDPQTAFAMRKRTWDTMVQMHKDRYGDEWEDKLKHCEVLGQGLTEAQAEGLVGLIKRRTSHDAEVV